MANEKILIVEDEKHLIKILTYNLEKEGYRVFSSSDGESGLALFKKERPDLVILDIMVPKMSGFEFCKAGRRTSGAAILMLSARKDEVDRVLGLELGADDYVTKPFSVRELLARIKAILRRGFQKDLPRPFLRAGDIEVDPERYVARVGGKPVALSPKEFEFLKCLFEAEGRALTRDQILQKVWGHDRALEIDTNTVDQHVARLRNKLGAESSRIVTVKNVGYRLYSERA